MHNSKSPETPRKSVLEFIKNIGRRQHHSGATRRKLPGRTAAVSRRNLGRTNLGLRQSCYTEETSLREGEIEAIVITNDPLIDRGSISININIFTSTISSQTLVHLLYPISVSKPQIGTCGLLHYKKKTLP